jgi:hypothetical protein
MLWGGSALIRSSIYLKFSVQKKEDILMLCDPLALQYVFHTSGYHFPKRTDATQVTKLMMGRGIVSASGKISC